VILAFVAVPLLFMMTVWVVVTCLRIWNPEKERPVERAADRLYRLRLHGGVVRRLRFEDIREMERDRQHDRTRVHQGLGDGSSCEWLRDLDLRRN